MRRNYWENYWDRFVTWFSTSTNEAPRQNGESFIPQYWRDEMDRRDAEVSRIESMDWDKAFEKHKNPDGSYTIPILNPDDTDA